MTTKILAFSGSAKKSSLNQKLVTCAAQYAKEAGAEITVINLGDFNLPLFDEDLEREQGTPQGAVELKELMKSHHGFLISSPEYNSSITPLLKNAIDWASRKADDESNLECFDGKVIGLMACSPGALGGMRGLFHVTSILGSIKSIVLPHQIAVGNGYQAFDQQGKLVEKKDIEAVRNISQKTVEFATKLK